MAVRRVNKYQYETSPRKLEPEYQVRNNRYPKKSSTPKTRTNTQINTKKATIRKKDRAKLVLALGLVFASILAISFRNSQIDESFSKNEEMKKTYMAIEKENDQMKVDIENSMNLNNVEQQAKELLGMQKLSNKQIVYITLPKKEYIQPATESVVIEKDESFVEKIINKLKNIF